MWRPDAARPPPHTHTYTPTAQRHALRSPTATHPQPQPQEAFAAMLRDAGFKAVTYENLTQGVVAIHSGFKL